MGTSGVQIRIKDSSNNIEGFLDVGDSELFPVSLSKKLTDIASLVQKSGTQSRSFEIPGTKNNDKLLKHSRQATHQNQEDIDQDKDSDIIAAGEVLEKGKLRVSSHVEKNGEGRYKVLFYGDNLEWAETLKRLTLADLSWPAAPITYDKANIIATWPNSATADNFVYALVNRGLRQNYSWAHPEDFRPELFLWAILKKAFADSGYTIESSFFSGAPMNRAILTHFGTRFVIDEATIAQSQSYVGWTTRSMPIRTNNVFVPREFLLYNDYTTTGGPFQFAPSESAPYDDSNNYFLNGDYVAPSNGYYDVTADLLLQTEIEQDGTSIYSSTFYTSPVPPGILQPPNPMFGRVICKVYNNAGTVIKYQQALNGDLEEFQATPTEQRFAGEAIQVPCIAGDRIRLSFEIFDPNQSPAVHALALTINEFSSVRYRLNPTINEGRTYVLSKVLDNEVKVIDLIADLNAMFNLTWRTDPGIKRVYVEPDNTFHDPKTQALDVSNRVDISKDSELMYLSQTTKRLTTLRFAEDKADKYVKGRDEDQGDIWGEYTHDFGDKFQEGERKVLTKIIAPTYFIEDNWLNSNITGKKGPWISRLWSEFTPDFAPPPIVNDFAPRVLIYNYNIQKDEVNNNREFLMAGDVTPRILIPYALPCQIKVSGVIQAAIGKNMLFHSIFDQDGLVKVHYLQKFTQIQNARRLTLAIDFSLKDWKEFDFRKLWYIRYPERIQGYWEVESLSGFNPNKPGPIKVVLLQRIDYALEPEQTQSPSGAEQVVGDSEEVTTNGQFGSVQGGGSPTTGGSEDSVITETNEGGGSSVITA